LSEIICHATIPIKAESYNFTFSDSTYTKATLYVPEESIDAYRATAYCWSKFLNIQPLSQYSDLEAVTISDRATTPEVFYDLTGKRYVGDAQSLTPGVYIVRQGVTSRKILVK
jgi:hypothetical protein